MAVFDDIGEIYIGAPVEEWSERSVIKHVHDTLTATNQRYILLANIQLEGRQIDCVVVTLQRVVVVEAKVSNRPVRGDMDGDWARLDVSGAWHQYRNGFRQAFAQKNRLVDAMRGHRQVGTFYPDAAVVFARPLPCGSNLTSGDFRVEVTDLDRFDPGGKGDRPNPWSLDDWRSFAASRSLRLASLSEVLAGTSLEPEYALLRDYRDRLAGELGREGDRWLAESDEQREALLASLDAAPGFYLEGPSGCGKTLAARWLGSRSSRSGECVLFLAAKDFDGSWAKLLKRELALTTGTNTSSLFGAIRATGTPVRIVLDGINELGVARDVALRGLRALTRRLDARVIVTGQSALAEQLAGLVRIGIGTPSVGLKERIAKAQLPTLSGSIRAILKEVTSGFEAAIVAEVGAAVPADASRQLLVDQFIRKRLGNAQRSGSAVLRRFAQTLLEATSFSMNETVFDETMSVNGVISTEIDTLFSAGILVRRGGRVSFAHEILLNACAAFAYAQLASKAGEKFAILLSVPALEPIATDILSVIEDPEVVAMVLRTSSDHGLIYEAARGLAGPVAAAAADRLLSQTEVELEAEIAGLRLAIVPGERASIAWERGTVRERSDREAARVGALAREIGTGHRLERYFRMCATMDAKLFEERRQLFDDALAAGIKALRSEAFRLAYLGLGSEPGFTKISRLAGSGMFDITDPVLRSPPRDMATLTSGQLHFYLERRRLFLDQADVDEVAEGLTQVINERFRLEPYHVKLAILHAAMFARPAAPEKVKALTDAIEAIDAEREGIWISTSIVEALKHLGALDDSAEDAREGIAAEFARAIDADEDELTRSLALGVSTAMFDHPYDAIYGGEFEELTPDRRRLLMRRAVRSEGVRTSWSLAWIVSMVASFDDPSDASIMQEFAKLPDPRNSMPQVEWGAFTIATRFLGRHRLALPVQHGTNDVEEVLIQLRALLHASEGGIDDEEVWERLEQLPVSAVMGCFCEVEHALLEQHWFDQPGTPRPSLVRAFPRRWLEIARRFLDGVEEAAHYHFAYDRDRAPGLAFQIIEMHGDRADIARLRRLANGSRHARLALDALRKLDAV